MAHTTKMVSRILGRRTDRKIEDVLGENRCGFRSDKRIRDATGMLRKISERPFDTEKELCACFIDWQLDWTELMQNLNVTRIDWRERTLIGKQYMDQCVKIKLDQVEIRSVKMEEELYNYALCLRFYSTYTTNTFPRNFLKALKISKWEDM
jgi:hypothetical protein